MSIKDYTIVKIIGKGSFGKIYEVEQKKTKKTLCIKKNRNRRIIRRRFRFNRPRNKNVNSNGM